MIFLIITSVAFQQCLEVKLADLQPMDGVYIFGAIEPPSMSGLRVTERVTSSDAGRFSIETSSTFAGHGSTPTTVRSIWYGLLTDPGQEEWSYDRHALAAVGRISPGENVEVPVRYIVELPSGPSRVDTITSVRHLGCQTRIVMGENIEVQAYEVSYQNVTVEGQNVRTTPSSFVREIAPSYGWWVASVSTHGTLVLVEVSD
jgi:hypothetical protein